MVNSWGYVQMLADIRPNEEHAKDYSERSQVSVGIQAAPDMSEHEVRLLAHVSGWAASGIVPSLTRAQEVFLT